MHYNPSTRTGNSAALHCQPVMRSDMWQTTPHIVADERSPLYKEGTMEPGPHHGESPWDIHFTGSCYDETAVGIAGAALAAPHIQADRADRSRLRSSAESATRLWAEIGRSSATLDENI